MKILSAYPSILCSNTRSAVQKLDQISATLKSKKIGCFIASETWFRDFHSDSFSAINGYACFRDDRLGRLGGGVAIWAKQELGARRISIHQKPSNIECVAIVLNCRLLVIGCYFPPDVAVACRDSVTSFLIEFIDDFLLHNTNCHVIICGDLNRYNISSILNHCNLINLHVGSTYGQNQLDYILISEDIAHFYEASLNAPFDNSTVPHLSILACPKTSSHVKELFIEKMVYDLRSSFIDDFVDVLALIDWSFLYHEEDSLDFKCEMFHYLLLAIFQDTIPSKTVKVIDNNKPWITPYIKSLINDRWFAYRTGNMPLYNHLKKKVKEEILKSKVSWAKKLSSKNIWSVVRTS